MAILATGLLSMAGVFIMGLSQLAGSSASLIAREKAREAVESVHTARDIRTLAWCRIRNRRGRDRLCERRSRARSSRAPSRFATAGDDGLVNTADDGARSRCRVGPGADGILGNADDTATPMTNYTRQIEIDGHPPAERASRTRTCGG